MKSRLDEDAEPPSPPWSPAGMTRCPYGARCYRTSVAHRETAAHPRRRVVEEHAAVQVVSVAAEQPPSSATTVAPPRSSSAKQHVLDSSWKSAHETDVRHPWSNGKCPSSTAESEAPGREPALGSMPAGRSRGEPVVLDSDDDVEDTTSCKSEAHGSCSLSVFPAAMSKTSIATALADRGSSLAKRALQGADHRDEKHARATVPAVLASRQALYSGKNGTLSAAAAHQSVRRPGTWSWQADGLGFYLLASEGVSNAGTVTLEDIFAGDFLYCIASNYCQDFGLVFRSKKLWTGGREDWCIPTTVFIHAKDGGQNPMTGEAVRRQDHIDAANQQIQGIGLQTCIHVFAPKLNRFGTHHSKFFILGHTDGIRVVIMTSNTCEGDLYAATNAVWAQDFPRKTAEQMNSTSPFENDLVDYLDGTDWQGMDAFGDWIMPSTLRKFDFSSARATIIGSIPGRHPISRDPATSEWSCKFGQLKLRSELQKVTFRREFVESPLLWQCTSIGAQSHSWLSDMIDSFSAGKSPSGPLGRPKDAVRLVWPTEKEVQGSIAILRHHWESLTQTKNPCPAKHLPVDELSCGFFQESSLHANAKVCSRDGVLVVNGRKRLQSDRCPPSEPRGKNPVQHPEVHFHRWSDPSRGQHPLDRTRAMPHIKTFMRHTHSGDSIAWILVGSHNLSKAAWGEIQHRKTDSPSLQIESFELSVLLHPANLDQSAEPPFTLSRSRASSQPTTHEQIVGFVPAHRPDWVEFERLEGGNLVVPIPYHIPTVKHRCDDVAWKINTSH